MPLSLKVAFEGAQALSVRQGRKIEPAKLRGDVFAWNQSSSLLFLFE
jgi:hypothetical protein